MRYSVFNTDHELALLCGDHRFIGNHYSGMGPVNREVYLCEHAWFEPRSGTWQGEFPYFTANLRVDSFRLSRQTSIINLAGISGNRKAGRIITQRSGGVSLRNGDVDAQYRI